MDEIIKIVFFDIDENYEVIGSYVANIDFIFKWANPEDYWEYFVQFVPKRIKEGILKGNDKFIDVFVNWLKWREADYKSLAEEVCYALDKKEQKLFLSKIKSKELVSYLQLKIFEDEQYWEKMKGLETNVDDMLPY